MLPSEPSKLVPVEVTKLVPLHRPSTAGLNAAVGFDFNSAVSNFALTWLPVCFFILMCVVVWLLWKTVKLMPRVKPMEITPGSSSSVTWNDVAGLEPGADDRLQLPQPLRVV